MQEFICGECDRDLKSASELLKHFAVHVQENEQKQLRKKSVPDLYPIEKSTIESENDIDKNDQLFSTQQQDQPQQQQHKEQQQIHQSQQEPDINPLKFCLVTMISSEEANSAPVVVDVPAISANAIEKTKKRKYPCTLCNKVFGWSTDLKRHLLIHTGERPFKCTLCDASFTRNFLLQKHQMKCHPDSEFAKRIKLPKLKPIDPSRTSRKQDKKKIKRNVVTCNLDVTKNCLYQSQNQQQPLLFQVADNLVYSN